MNYGYNYTLKPRKVGAAAFNPADLANTFFYSDPTIASSINLGVPVSNGDPVSNRGDLSPAGNDAPQATVINQATWNTTHESYTTNDFEILDDVLTDIATSTQGTIALWISPTDATPIANNYLISFGDTNGDAFLGFAIFTTGKIDAFLRVGGVTLWRLETDAIALSDATFGYVYLEHDGTEPKFYINNVAVAQTFLTGTAPNKAKWFNDIPLADNGRIGCLSYNSGGEGSFVEGDIQQIYISTDVKDAATRTSLYNKNQP